MAPRLFGGAARDYAAKYGTTLETFAQITVKARKHSALNPKAVFHDPVPSRPRGVQRWSTFLRNHARGVIACDFLVSVTSTFRVLYVLVVIEHHSRRLIYFNVTAHPTAHWTRQQLREAVGYEERYEYLLHDRDAIFSIELDESIRRLGLRVLKSPPRSPKANSICELVIGTIRRECLDWLIPLSEAQLRQTLKSWVAHYNRWRPHSALGPGVPDPPAGLSVPLSKSRHRRRLSFRACQSNTRRTAPRVLAGACVIEIGGALCGA
jgi:transposase InsO family protein